ncbi:lipid-A-disaccharide synthase [Poriferisphaera corsica]|uniref:Lipid-A-disaccharide synthase n=1 Tax=Poriferisphaera corsica TaxID=2528020 RepID=A0A517YWC3_9BACT|nr:lipid-A-disaccharide synthase N-terminal domain-containing protein [Poriferisphaera corsica]QDU34523.1 lipid-A-disaccharide synthase [Poriferisphaera corsica]
MKIRITKTRVIVCSIIAALAAVGITYGIYSLLNSANTITIKTIPSNAASAQLIKTPDQGIQYQIKTFDGQTQHLSPNQFASEIYNEHTNRTLKTQIFVTIFNITNKDKFGWVALGLLGQLVFAGRMIVQIIASEKKRQSVVPVAFWWMALTGASMLLLYFVWRKDVVGIIGQSTGWLIYTRNLYFIYLKPSPPTTLEDTEEGNLPASE